ncbi:MAG: DUF4827 family protein [Bacteroidales bacterium]|nr:DUF4827 family protein [Bacteroidales bacterium]
MKTLRTTILLLAAVLTGLTACSKYKTYAQQLEEMEDSIDAFMLAHDYVEVPTMPASVPWTDSQGRRQFYKTSSGLYLHVADTGYSAGHVKKGQVVYVRYTEMSVKGDSITYSNMKGASSPVEICYGTVNTGMSNNYYWGDCQAWHEPLQYVGDYGHVMVIAPTDLGMPVYNQSQAELLAHYYELRYTFQR